jgi:hypothetical protein
MQKTILMIVALVVMGQSVLAADKKPLIASSVVEAAIRRELEKPTGELTEADLGKVTRLNLIRTQITDAGLKELVKCKQLTGLHLSDTKTTKAGAAEFRKAMPKCAIFGP